MIAYLFDTETSGLIDNHTVPLKKQPSIIEFYGCSVNLETGEILNELHHLIKPPQPITDEIAGITHITNEMLENAPPFADVSNDILNALATGGRPMAHNASF